MRVKYIIGWEAATLSTIRSFNIIDKFTINSILIEKDKVLYFNTEDQTGYCREEKDLFLTSYNLKCALEGREPIDSGMIIERDSQTKYDIGQIVEVYAFDCDYGTCVCRFEIKSIVILKDNNITYHMKGNGMGIGFAEQDIIRVVEIEKKNLISLIENIDILIPKISKEKLLEKAIGSYNNMQAEREIMNRSFSDQVNKNSDKEFLDRICVNFLRHQLTDYEEILSDISGKVGFSDGYFEIRKKIFFEISNRFPWLRQECERQCGEKIQEEE